jgi:signal peptidase I
MHPRRSLWLGLLAAGVVVAVLVWLAPPQLGGSTIYSATVGTSMEPLFHKGDLALVRPASSYHVGDIVLYESPILHRPVLHRILVIQHGLYYFKGDNNSFVDPGYVTRDELLGKLWIHLPKVGVGLSFIGEPAHAGALAGLAVLVLLLGGSSTGSRRRRRRGRASPGGSPPVRKIPAFPGLHRPRRSTENICAAVALVLGVLALVVGFTTPLAHTVPAAGAYNQIGTFSYRSTLDKPDTAYPDGVVSTGQPVFLTDFTTLDVGFGYRFATQLAHHVTGTIGLDAILSSTTSNWTRTYVLEKPVAFQGDVAKVKGTVDLHKLRALTVQLGIDTGTPVAEYDWKLVPQVHVRGRVAGKRIVTAFGPTLPFTFSTSVLALDAPAPTTLPGATYAPPTIDQTNATALQPVLAGTLPVRAPNSVKVVKFKVAVNVLRGFGLALVGLALLLIFTKPLRKKRDTWSNEKRIAFRLGCVIIDVVSLESAVASTGAPTALPDFESLASFARYLERPILHDVSDGAYATEDSGRLYVFRQSGERGPPAPMPTKALELTPRIKASASQPRSTRRRKILSLVGVLFAGSVAVGLVTSFTATNTVPMSQVGVSKQTLNVNQLSSQYCASLTLTKLVVATSSTVTGTSGNDLVLGRNATGSQSLNAGAGDDCVIAGGGTSSTTNAIDGGTGTNICIGAPYTVMTFTNCTYAGTPSTGHAVGLSTWTNVSGSTLASIPTFTAATSSSTLASLETPTNRGDNLGTRIQAYLTPAISGSYTFWIASDDNGQLFLSTDSTAANRQPIASVSSYTNPEAYDTFPSQQSSAISLVAGQRYYIEAWSKESTGGDNLSVAWSGPSLSRQVISGDYLSATTAGCSGWCPTTPSAPSQSVITSFAGKCADVTGASQTAGTAVIQYTCSTAVNQMWTLASNGALQVYSTPKCMAPKGGSLTAGTVMVISACDGSAAQTFTYSSSTGLLKDGTLCLEVPGASTADSVQLALNTCNGKPEQNWS